jgi:hypothetical protein
MKGHPLGRKQRIVFRLIVLLIPIVAFSTLYLVYTAYRTRALYFYVKTNQRGWRGIVYKRDAELGFAPVANSVGAETFPDGDEIPARFDQDGFRIPLDDEKNRTQSQHPSVLTLGCSFTYGAAARAEDTYPYLVGRNLGGSTKNAAVSSYGLSQMLILAKRLVPGQKPDYLLVQYSPWLVSRALDPFAPTYFGKLPTPYFFDRQSELVLQPPVFQTKMFDLPIDRYRNTPTSFSDKVSFSWNVGLPIFVHDDFNMIGYAANRFLRRVPAPASDEARVTTYVYGQIGKIAKENGAKLIVVVLGNDVNSVPISRAWFPADAAVVNAHDALLEHLPVAAQEKYDKAYAFWRGSPPAIVDRHPNENAHRVIADAVAREIGRNSDQRAAAMLRKSNQ